MGGVQAVYPKGNSEAAAAETAAFAEDVPAENFGIALHPFKGYPEEMAGQFYEVLRAEVPKADNGRYIPYLIDLYNLPDDVPEGGFAAYVCPSPSITNDSAFAITGEIFQEEGADDYHLRLYLWEMGTNRLVFTDELTAFNREDCETSLPILLGWLLSWIDIWETHLVALPPLDEPEKWFYLGVRTGSSFRFYSRPEKNPFAQNDVMHFFNINAALQASVHLMRYLDIQAEAIFTTDYAPFTLYSESADKSGVASTSSMVSQSLMFPLLARANMRKGQHLMAGALAGPYFFVPLGQMQNNYYGGSFDYNTDLPIGYTLGINVGMKLGPGYLFLDTRWAADLGALQTASGENLYKRSMVSLNIGYEMGFLTKKPRESQ